MSSPWQPPDRPAVPPTQQPQPTATQPPVYQAQPGYRSPTTDQAPQSGGVVAIAWIVAVITFLYMLPWAIAVSRGKSNHGAIALVNLLVGWTLIGWIVALVMACQAHQTIHGGQTVVVAQQFASAAPAGWYPAPDGRGRQYWDGHAWTSHRAD